MNEDKQWPEDRADWPQTASVVQGGVSPAASVVVNDRESADLASAVRNVINKVEKKMGFRPDVVITKHRHAAQPVVSAPGVAPQPATNDCREGKSSAVNAFETSEDGRKFVADYFANVLLRQDFAGYINEHLAADFACALADGLHALQKHCDGFAEQAAFQRDARLGVLKELAKVEWQRDMLLDVLNKAANDLAYVAYNLDGSKLDDLKAGLSESTCPSETALIAERNCREAISRVKGGAEE